MNNLGGKTSHPKPHLAFYISVYSDVYPSSINVSKHFTVILYSKGEELPVVDDVRTRIIQNKGYFYIPELKKIAWTHPKPHITFNIPVNPDVYPSGINIPKHFTVILYSKVKKLRIFDFISLFIQNKESYWGTFF